MFKVLSGLLVFTQGCEFTKLKKQNPRWADHISRKLINDTEFLSACTSEFAVIEDEIKIQFERVKKLRERQFSTLSKYIWADSGYQCSTVLKKAVETLRKQENNRYTDAIEIL